MANKNPTQSETFKTKRAAAGFGSPFATAKTCAGWSRQNDRPCRNRAAWGLEHCRYHLTGADRAALRNNPDHKPTPERRARHARRQAALDAIQDAPPDVLRLPVYRAARSLAERAAVVLAYVAAQAGDGRAWADLTGRYNANR